MLLSHRNIEMSNTALEIQNTLTPQQNNKQTIIMTKTNITTNTIVGSLTMVSLIYESQLKLMKSNSN